MAKKTPAGLYKQQNIFPTALPGTTELVIVESPAKRKLSKSISEPNLR